MSKTTLCKFVLLASALLLPALAAAQRYGMRPDLAGWPPTSSRAAQMMMERYGPPDEVSDSMLTWHRAGQFKRTTVYREPVAHDWPVPHHDVLEQVIDYRVPPNRFDDLARYNGSITANRTAGELAVRCDREDSNLLSLNLAHEIASGLRTTEDARAFHVQSMEELMNGEPGPYVQGLRIDRRALVNTADPDRASPALAMQPREDFWRQRGRDRDF